MRVAIMNTAAIINNTLAIGTQPGFNPNLFNLVSVNADLFKIEDTNAPTQALLVNKINLNDLFSGDTISLEGITFGESSYVDLTDWIAMLGTDTVTNLPKLDNLDWEVVGETDTLGQWFMKFIRLTGLVSLSRTEVSLGLVDDIMTVSATNAKLYTGSVNVKLPS